MASTTKKISVAKSSSVPAATKKVRPMAPEADASVSTQTAASAMSAFAKKKVPVKQPSPPPAEEPIEELVAEESAEQADESVESVDDVETEEDVAEDTVEETETEDAQNEDAEEDQAQIAADLARMLNGSGMEIHVPYTDMPNIVLTANGKPVTKREQQKEGGSPYSYTTLRTFLQKKTANGEILSLTSKSGNPISRRIITPEFRTPRGVTKQGFSMSIMACPDADNPYAMEFVRLWNENIHEQYNDMMRANQSSFPGLAKKPPQSVYFASSIYEGEATDGGQKRYTMFMRIQDFKATDKLPASKTQVFIVGKKDPIPVEQLEGRRFRFYASISIPHIREAAASTGPLISVDKIYITHMEESGSSESNGSKAAMNLASNPALARKARNIQFTPNESLNTPGADLGKLGPISGASAGGGGGKATSSEIEEAFTNAFH